MSALDPKLEGPNPNCPLCRGEGEYVVWGESPPMRRCGCRQSLATPPKGQAEAVAKLVREYRPTMDKDVLHSWDSDVVAALASPAPAGEYVPSIIYNEEAGISELVLRDCPTYVAEELTVRAIRDMLDRSLIGFQWPAPAGGGVEDIIERCAKIAEDEDGHFTQYGEDRNTKVAQQTASNIAAAIRALLPATPIPEGK